MTTTAEKCKICSSNLTTLFTTKILNKYTVKYFQCSTCDFVQTEKAFWLNEAYETSINDTDAGLLARNAEFAQKIASIISFFFNKDASYVDYGGGYGVFTRLMRDIGFNFYWSDPHTKNLMAQGFEWNKITEPKLITLFETFEHFEYPIEEIKKLLTISDNILFSTTLVPTPTPAPQSWWYYGREHGQHIALYRIKTFEYIAKELGVNYINNKNLHLFSKKKISPFKFKLALKVSKYIFPFIKKILKSKTHSDMVQLISNNNHE